MKDEKLKVVEYYTDSLFKINYIKNYLRIDNNFDDEFLKNSIIIANNYAEKITNKVLCLKKYELSFYTSDNIVDLKKINLKVPYPITEINEVFVDGNSIDGKNYEIKNGVILFNKDIVGDIKIVFNAGFCNNDIQEELKQAMLFHITSIYQNKSGNCLVPQASKEIYNLYRNIMI